MRFQTPILGEHDLVAVAVGAEADQRLDALLVRDPVVASEKEVRVVPSCVSEEVIVDGDAPVHHGLVVLVVGAAAVHVADVDLVEVGAFRLEDVDVSVGLLHEHHGMNGQGNPGSCLGAAAGAEHFLFLGVERLGHAELADHPGAHIGALDTHLDVADQHVRQLVHTGRGVARWVGR